MLTSDDFNINSIYYFRESIMYLQKPKFKFCLFLVDNEKKKINQTICLAETYEIQQDGSIVFYQIAVKNEKNIKVPVLAYPKGKWEACILVDDNNEYPVFSQNSNFSESTPVQNTSNSIPKQNAQNYNSPKVNIPVEDDFDDLSSFGNSANNSAPLLNPSMNSNASQSNNPQEFKKLKSEWLEKLIIDFTKTQDFHLIQFMKSLTHDPQLKTFKPTENDIVWAAASLIQNRLVLSRKFSNPMIQKQFDLILGSIMKRLWDGQMSPILTTLQEKEETKDANAIDLAVWMSKNNY